MGQLLLDFSRKLGLFRYIQDCLERLLKIIKEAESKEGIKLGLLAAEGGWEYKGKWKLRGKVRPLCNWDSIAALWQGMKTIEYVNRAEIESALFRIEILPSTTTKINARNYVLYMDESLAHDVVTVVEMYTGIVSHGPSELVALFDLTNSDGGSLTRKQLKDVTYFDEFGLVPMMQSHAQSRQAIDTLLAGVKYENADSVVKDFWEFQRTWGGICLTKSHVQGDYDSWHVILRCVMEDNRPGLEDALTELGIHEPARGKCVSAIFNHRDSIRSWNFIIRETVNLYEQCRGLFFAPAATPPPDSTDHAFLVSRGESGGGWIYCNRYVAVWLLKMLLMGYFLKSGECKKLGLVLGYEPKMKIEPGLSAKQGAAQILSVVSPGWSGRVEEECSKMLSYVQQVCMPEQMGDSDLI